MAPAPSGFLAILLLAGSSLHAAAATAPAPAAAGEPPSAILKTLMCERGKLVFDDDMNAQSCAKNWGGWMPGAWKNAPLMVGVTGVAGEHHPYRSRGITLSDMVIQVAFRFDGVDWLGVGLDDAKTHILRCNIHPDGFDLQRWENIGKDKKDDQVDHMHARFDQGTWHTLVWEIHGTEMVASVDEQLVLCNAVDGIDIPKTRLAIFSALIPGKYAWFAHIRLWEASLKPDWAKKREQVLAYKAKRR